MKMEGRELRRSYTQMDFPTQRTRPHHHQGGRSAQSKQQRFGQQQQSRSKFPTQEIYRPPSQEISSASSMLVKSAMDLEAGQALHSTETLLEKGTIEEAMDSGGQALPSGGKVLEKSNAEQVMDFEGQREGGAPAAKLNVHAKEFAPLTSNLPLQNSKSTGSILATVHNEGRHKRNIGFPLSNSKSVNNQLQQLVVSNAPTSSSKVSHGNDRDLKTPSSGYRVAELQRSKSTTSAIPQPIDFSIFGKKASIVEAAYTNPGGLRAPVLLEIAKLITEKAQEQRSWAESLASLSFYLIEREKQTTFIEGLLNMLQYIVGKKCKDGSAGDSFYFPFISYLHALYGEVKPNRIEYEKNGRSPALTLLTLLVEVCIDFLRQEKLTGRRETESLFFVVTTIGRDLESESPRLMEGLMSAVRDAFLSEGATAPIRRTLLQLVELRAAHWQLPARTIHYYQTYLTAA